MISKLIQFHNNTDLPLMIDSWVDNSNVLQSIKIYPRESVLLHSSVGEWHIHSMLESKEDRMVWEEKEIEELTIGTFRSQPCASGNYSWLDCPSIFTCEYTQEYIITENNDRVGLITFSQK